MPRRKYFLLRMSGLKQIGLVMIIIFIIFNAPTNPKLNIIKNPAKNLNVIEKIETVRFIMNIWVKEKEK